MVAVIRFISVIETKRMKAAKYIMSAGCLRTSPELTHTMRRRLAAVDPFRVDERWEVQSD